MAWQALSRSLYGSAQVRTGLSFLGQFHAGFARQLAERHAHHVRHPGLDVPRLDPGRRRVCRRRVAIGAGLPASWRRPRRRVLLRVELPAASWVHAGFLAGVGLGAFGFVAAVCAPRPLPAQIAGPRLPVDDLRPLLWAWILGVAAIVIPFGPFVATRSFLPIHPPLGLLLLSRSGRRLDRGALGAALGLTVVWACRWRRPITTGRPVIRTRSSRLKARYGPDGRPIVFLGHWGWQYYAERAGFLPWDAALARVPDGAIVVIPLRADRQALHPVGRPHAPAPRADHRVAEPLGLTTWNRPAGLRFYGGDYGELPWGFSSQPAWRSSS